MCHLILFCLLSFCLQQSKEQATNSSSLLTQQHEGAVILEIDQANKTVYDPHQASAQVVQRNLVTRYADFDLTGPLNFTKKLN